MAGREYFNQMATNNETVIDVVPLAVGMYLVVVKDHEQARRLKFMKR